MRTAADLYFLNRQALRYIIRNTSLPQRVRAQAQLQLSQMHCYTRPTQIKNRCVASGHARSVFRDFRLNRVSDGPLVKIGRFEKRRLLTVSRWFSVPIPYAGTCR